MMSGRDLRARIPLLPPGPEAALIRQAALWPTVPTAPQADLLAAAEDKRLVDMAVEHRLLPPLGKILRASGCAPGSAMRAAEQQTIFRSLRQMATTLTLLGQLEKAGCRALVLKGQALSAQLYGQPDIRMSHDIDLLIDPQTAIAAHHVMINNGYHPYYPVSVDRLSLTTKDQIYTGPAGPVELHWRLFDNALLVPWDFETLWADKALIALSGNSTVPTLSRDRHVLYQAVHGLLHGWARLRWLADMVVPLQRIDDLECVLDLAERYQLLPVMVHTMRLARDVLGVELAMPVPGTERQQAIADSIDRRVDSLARTRVTVGYERVGGWARRRLAEKHLALLICPNAKAARAELFSHLVGVGDLIDVRLPRRLTWLYFLLRPLLLLRRTVARAIRKRPG
ncbi:hypothetical protein CHU95_02150 [Niveispirillum lacus]|uniref:Nucleotidyltransferase n=1 Tax=Niveispirillum lacus TaxID=1981099 RepID=A0A255Z6X1_9PROT|nr:nucleotidyltransferase family protein [Niveispirillum lacus]OYQ37171.1 hypothetical protein CHU95_02150 [Niveispirillum lacus]